MHRTVAVVAVLCLCSSVAVVAGGPVTTATTATAMADRGSEPSTLDPSTPVLATAPNDTTSYLAIPPENVTNATVTEASLDVGGALAADAAATKGRVAALAIDERLSRANTTAAKQVVIRDAGERIEGRIDRLSTSQRAAIAAYSNGGETTREFVYTLAHGQVRASELLGAVSRLETAAASVPGTAIGGESVASWARDRRVELGIVTSPLRGRLVGAFRGFGPIGVYVEVGNTGVVLATTDRGRYVRDSYLPADRADGPPDGPAGLSAALDRVIALYPWAWNTSTGVESAGGPAAESYRITVFHRQGRLTTHLDPRTGSVFREVQVKSLRRVPTAPPITATGEGLDVAVRRTYATGPMNVSVTEATSGEPVNATVVVDDRTVGRTGLDGSLWAISPRGELNLTVTDGDRVVTTRFASSSRAATGDDGATAEGTAMPPPADRPAATGTRSPPPGNRSIKAGTETATTTAGNATIAPGNATAGTP